MSFNLSIVNICKDEHRAAINQLAESFNTGENNMSVKLIDKDGGIWWGCHAWWKQEDCDFFKNEIQSSSGYLIESVAEGGDPYKHWVATLSKNNLRQIMYDLDGNELSG